MRNVNKFINVTSLNSSLKKNSSFNNLSNVSKKNYSVNYNKSITPPNETLNNSSGFKQIEGKRFVIRNQKKPITNKVLSKRYIL